MAHKNWCGNPCCICNKTCKLYEDIRCYPDCKGLNENGTRNINYCLKCGCDNFGSCAGECPVCRNENLTYTDSSIEGKFYNRKWFCDKCGKTGNELYSLEFIQHKIDGILEKSTPVERFAVYRVANREGVYAVWDSEKNAFYEDENGNTSTFTDIKEAEIYRLKIKNIKEK